MGRTHAVVVGFALLVLGCTSAPRAPDRTIRFHSEVRSARLDNGILVLVAEDHDTNLVEVAVRFDAGSAQDPPGKAGLAHLVEHLMFQRRSEGRPITGDLLGVAIWIGAHTTWDSTHFAAMARADQLERILELEVRRFASGCAGFEEASFEREREVVRNELRLRHPGSWHEYREKLHEAVYAEGHPYHRQVAGDDDQVSRLELADVCEFLSRNYTADRMRVVISGDVAAEPAIEVVRRHLGALTGRAPRLPLELPAIRPREVRYLGPDLDSRLYVAWPLPPTYTDEYFSAIMALEVVERKCIEDQALGFCTTSLMGGPRGPAAVLTVLAVNPKRVDEEVAAVWGVVGRAVRERDERVFDHVNNRAARALMSEFDSLTRRADGFADALQFRPDRHPYAHGLTAIERATPQRVREAARTYLSRQKAVVVVFEANRAGTATPKPREEGAKRDLSQEDDAWKAPVEPAEADRPLPIPMPRLRLDNAEQLRLENGLRIILVRSSSAPVVAVQLVFAGGSAATRPGLAWAAAS